VSIVSASSRLSRNHDAAVPATKRSAKLYSMSIEPVVKTGGACCHVGEIIGDESGMRARTDGVLRIVQQVESLPSWQLTTADARDPQLQLAGRVKTKRNLSRLSTVAGADVSSDLRGEWLYAAIIVLRMETWEVIERSGKVVEARFPYVPGLLSFREAPPVIEAYKKLTVRPDVLICDGQGIAHPLVNELRRLGRRQARGLDEFMGPRGSDDHNLSE
jgi:hypothetical protein